MSTRGQIDKSLFDYTGKIEVNGYDVSLSYKDIMIIAGQFRYEVDEEGNRIDPDPLNSLEEKIAKITAFNFTVTKVITTRENQTAIPVDHDVCDDYSYYIVVNNVRLDTGSPDYDLQEAGEMSKDLIDNLKTYNTLSKSFAIYNTSSIDIKLLNSLYRYYDKGINIDEEGEEEKNHDIPSGTIFSIPLIVEDINRNSIKILLQIEYVSKSEEEEENNESNPDGDNEWNIVDDDADELIFTDPYVSKQGYEDYVYVNTYSFTDIRNLPNSTLYAKDTFAKLYVDPRCVESFTIMLYVNGVLNTWRFNPSLVNIKGKNYSRITKMNSPEVSYALLRTNPKLTGNVKVVVDSDSNIYLDTFKVSTALSQKQYRKVKVSSSDYYGTNLMTKFKSMPTTDFYKIEDQCYTLFTPAQTYKGEYYDMYRMGAKTNDDDLYKENYSIFAPICLKEYCPDFFVVFKVDKKDGEYNEDTDSDIDKLKYFIKTGKVVKSYDMRQGSPLGDYVHNIIRNSSSFVGDIYESYEKDNYNRFIGISLDKGVVTSMYESPFNEDYINNQVALNDYYTEGFERNHIVSKNIINLEFMFDDPSAELFSINTYFGLYIKVNSDQTFSCSGTSGGINEFDTELNTYQSTKSIGTENNPFIYGLATPNEFIRLTESVDISNKVSEFALKPYKNIVATPVIKEDINIVKSFITIKINDLLLHGDHLRIIDNDTQNIYEVIIANSEDINSKYEISPVIMNTSNDGQYSFSIYRVSVYFNKNEIRKPEEISSGESISNCIDKVYRGFKKLEDYTHSNSYVIRLLEDNSFGIEGHSSNMIFERICYPSGLDTTLNEYIFETDDEEKIISFFKDLYPKKLILNLNDDTAISSEYRYLYPLNFEVVGSRMAYAMSFISSEDVDEKYLYCGEILDTNVFDTKSILYRSEDEYKLYEPFKLKYFFSDKDDKYKLKEDYYEIKYVYHFKDNNKYILNVRKPDLNINSLLLYSAYPLNEGLCSIFDVKDFDFEVLDSDSKISLSLRSDSGKIGHSGEYSEGSIFTSLSSDNDNEMTSEENEEAEPIVLNYHFENMIDASTAYTEEEHKNKYVDFFRSFTNKKYAEEHGRLDWYNTYFNANLNGDSYFKVVLRPFVSDEYPIENTEDPQYDHLVQVNIAYSILEDIGADNYLLEETDERWEEDGKNNANYPYNIDPEKMFHQYDPPQIYKEKSSFTGDTTVLPANTIILDKSEENIHDYIDKYQQLREAINNRYEENTKDDDTTSIDENDSSIKKVINQKEYLKCSLASYYEGNHRKLDVSLVAPHVCKWKSIGTDARGENLRLMYDYDSLVTERDGITNKSYYVCGTDSYNTYLGYLCYPNKNNESKIYKKYFTKSLTSPTTSEYTSQEHSLLGMYLKDSILSDKGALDDILYDSKDNVNKFSVAYKCGDNTLEFISAGVKFRIKSNNDNAINLNNYHGYSAIFVSLPDINKNYAKDTEIIIDETRKEIMIVWYQPVNTFKYGNSYYTNETYLLESTKLFTCKLRNAYDFSNVFCSYASDAIDENASYSIARLPDIDNFGSSNIIDENTGRRGRRLCKRKGYIYFTSMGSEDSYTKLNKLMFVGRLFHSKPIIKGTPKAKVDVAEKGTYPYYFNDGNITLLRPFFWYNNNHDAATNSVISANSYDYSKCINAYLVTDSPSCIISETSSFSTLKDVINNCAIYIKTADGKKDYTTLSNVLTLSVVEPIEYLKPKFKEGNGKGYVHSTYGEPVMKSILNFLYNDSSGIETIFKKSFDGGNIFISGVNSLNQEWINKYTEENNFCVYMNSKNNKVTSQTSSYLPSIDVVHNKSVMDSSWSKKLYRKYYLYEETVDSSVEIIEDYDYINGYTTGYEQKNFFNSRGIQLKKYTNGIREKDDIEITEWRNTSMSYTKGYIRLNITDSLIYMILNDKNFLKAWKYLKLSSNDSKINYIKNTVLPLININNKSRFILKENRISNSKFTFEREYNDNFYEVSNYKNSLTFENGKYYMYVYPENDYTYSVKMIIDL